MDPHALHVLEFSKVKDHLRALCVSPLGREAVDRLQPLTALEVIRLELAETSEMVRLHEARQEPLLEGLYDVREPLHRSRVAGAILDPAEILLIRDTAAGARKIKNSLKNLRLDAPAMRRYGDRLIPLPEVEEAVGRVFDEKANLRDSASPDLARIRKALRQQRNSLVDRLERLIRGGWKEYLQETLYTQREGRYVLPVDSRYQSKVRGIIHDRSASNTTVYMEPIELVEDGNALKDLQRNEDIEIHRILRELTADIARQADSLEQNLSVFQHLDFVAAKARFSIRHQLNEPALNGVGEFEIRNGRHPLLMIQNGRDNVVPMSLHLQPDTRGLVITGPNTGGKTVVLKTIGLVVLMAQCGLHVPADPNTQLPVFQYIGADIGDEQSLEQNLSTFSSHMQNIRLILENARERSLVLLDELGSGTDPIEGGALSCAILEQLHKQRATYIVTTHLQDLKIYAHSTEGVENGAMDFDMQNLQPTYSFSMGLPGKSNAIQIANRLGLPPSVIARAHESIERLGNSPEDLLFQLGEELRVAREKRVRIDQEYEKAKNRRDESEQRINKAKNEAQEIVRRADRRAQDLVSEFEKRLKDLEKKEQEFKKQWQDRLAFLLEQTQAASSQPAGQPSASGAFAGFQKELERSKKELQEKQKPKPQKSGETIERRYWRWDQLKPGVRVRIQGIQDEGEVVSVSEKKNEVEVNVSVLTFRVKADRISAILQPAPKPKLNVKTDVTIERPENMNYSLDIHGMTVEEMTPLVEKYLDQAFRSGMPAVRIVHGHGFGVLRRVVRSMLKDHPLVREFGNGEDYEGGNGVTVVKLRQSS